FGTSCEGHLTRSALAGFDEPGAAPTVTLEEIGSEGVRIEDGRNPRRHRSTEHPAVHGAILGQLQRRAMTPAQLASKLRPRFGRGAIDDALDELSSLRYVLFEGSSCASLVFPEQFYASPENLRGLVELGYRSLARDREPAAAQGRSRAPAPRTPAPAAAGAGRVVHAERANGVNLA
ncbi:MAG: hypothetical protein MI919_04305, partial [Holophagales bacterium]|nr:hypothetical protein [Holophagales bacterium]